MILLKRRRQIKSKEDFIERVVKIEDKSECTSQIYELLRDFTGRVINFKKLAKDPKILKIKIGENKLEMDEDLFQLFCVEANLFRSDGVDILAGKVLYNNKLTLNFYRELVTLQEA